MTARFAQGSALIRILCQPTVRERPTLGEWWRTLLCVLSEVPQEIRSRLQ